MLAGRQFVTWPGSNAERDRLLAAINANCDCGQEPPTVCSAHKMILDQATLNRMVFVAHIRETFISREQKVTKT